jgi:hypothetical protein
MAATAEHSPRSATTDDTSENERDEVPCASVLDVERLSTDVGLGTIMWSEVLV